MRGARVRFAPANGMEMDRPEYFIVRVYRRAPDEHPQLEGVVEVVATLRQHSFTSSDQLWGILCDPSLAQWRSAAR